MNSSSVTLRVGARSSQLAKTQTRRALDRYRELLPDVTFEEVWFSSPGDRDRTTDLRASDPDFFTKDLDDALREGKIDMGVHSAKDLPDPVPEDLDWYWLPWRADPRDVIVLAPGRPVSDLPDNPVVGVSSDRREAWCLKRFPNAIMKPIRGNIEHRLEQVDKGDFDICIMASAALIRLDLEDRITEWIPLEELPAPDGQGYLAVTFRKGDERMIRLRSLTARSVVFAGGGIGPDAATLATVKAMQRCDVCLHDTLMDQNLLKYLRPDARVIDVGKRCGQHSVPQDETTALIEMYARRGMRLLRLKGGDPSIFGRLAEEAEALDALHLPYRVIPGISSLNRAACSTGMLLTRRGLSRGFCVMTPRMQGGGIGDVAGADRAALPIVYFMSVSSAREVSRQMIEDGTAPDTPAAVVFDAGGEREDIVRGTLENLADKIVEWQDAAKAAGRSASPKDCPGLFIVGEVTNYSFSREWGALRGQRVLLTCSEALQDSASALVLDAGGIPVQRPLIRLTQTAEAEAEIRDLGSYDWVVLTSPSAVRCFIELLDRCEVDRRRTPRLLVCGSGTEAELKTHGLHADLRPEGAFNAESVVEVARPAIEPGARVLRLRSDKAGPSLAKALRELGLDVTDALLYQNERVEYDAVPEFESVFFASASAVEAFVEQWGTDVLTGKTITAIGQPTLRALQATGLEADVVGVEATVESCLETLAGHLVKEQLSVISDR